MTQPILLVPGLNATARVFAELVPALWPAGPVTVANHTQGAGIEGIAAQILAAAPPRFGLLGFSMGGYLAFEMLRQAPERVLRLCLLDTSARPDTPEATARRQARIAMAEAGRFRETIEEGFEMTVHADHLGREDLRAVSREMALETGPEVFIRQQQAIIGRPDSRGLLAGITVPTRVIVGDADQITPPEVAREMAGAIPGAALTIIARAGHMAILEQPEATIAAIADWATSPR